MRREKRIPFDVSIDPFYSEANIGHLKNIISEIENQKDIHDLINEFLSSVIEERGNRLIIFIDELDRCKPSYAIQLLERIKHYFINDNLTFVFSVNLLYQSC